ncbi:MAG: ABC transporter permease subunit [Faecousia sp.]
MFANLWKNVGYSTVLYLAAITGIDANQYEAAAIDGASKWQQVLYVTLPDSASYGSPGPGLLGSLRCLL